jgi:hypothetical protein
LNIRCIPCVIRALTSSEYDGECHEKSWGAVYQSGYLRNLRDFADWILKILQTDDNFLAEKFIPEIDALVIDVVAQIRLKVVLDHLELAMVVGNTDTTTWIVPIFIQIL